MTNHAPREVVPVWVGAIRALVRPMVTFGMTGAVIYGVIQGIIGYDVIVGIMASILGFYFGERSALKTTKGG